MEQPLSKATLITALRASRAELESVVSQVPPERMRMIEPGACGSWSVKDVLARLAETLFRSAGSQRGMIEPFVTLVVTLTRRSYGNIAGRKAELSCTDSSHRGGDQEQL